MQSSDPPVETFSGHEPADVATDIAPFEEEPERNRRFRANLRRVLDAMREACAESASVHFTGWGCTLQFQGVRYTPVDTDGESTRVSQEVVSHELTFPAPDPWVGIQEMTLNKALEVLAVAHGERSGIYWRDTARVRTVIRVRLADESVRMSIHTP